MRSALCAIGFFVCVMLSLPQKGMSQDSPSIYKNFNRVFSFPSIKTSGRNFSKFNFDSVAKQKFLEAVSLPDTNGLSSARPSIKNYINKNTRKPFFKLGSGYVMYNWNYRSGIDTPVIEKNLSQHLLSASFNATVANFMPVRITYFERQSNSDIFRDFRDVRVELNTQELQRLQINKFRNYLSGLAATMRDPLLKPGMEASLKKINQLKSWLNYSSVKKKFIDSKELLLSPELADTAFGAKKDSLISEAEEFVILYEKLEEEQTKYQHLYDSLQRSFVSIEKKIKQFQQLANGNLNQTTIRTLEEMAKQQGIKDQRFSRLSNTISSIRTLAVGKTIPNFSNLTLRNTNVRGLNFEYNRNNVYLAVAAGSVDFRVRDFVYEGQKRVSQYVYSGRIGYGVKERNNLVLTYFEGKKQMYAGINNNKSHHIKGVSLAGQFLLAKNHKLNAEVAQSASPSQYNSSNLTDKVSLNFKDKNNQAYSLQLRSSFPATRTSFEGHYQHNGINFQSFSNYRVNAAANSWYFKAEQYFWKKNLRLVAALRKNDFSNPYILQRYNANTIFKNFTATFRKRNWPVLSAGFMPSSQYTVVDSVMYENRYQVLNATVNHQYKVGSVTASSAMMFNRFYNDNQDTGFIYHNANNIFLNQAIYFPFCNVNVSINHTENGIYSLDVWDAGLLVKVLKENALGFGVKIHNLNNTDNPKVGLYGNARFLVPKVGELNLWLEKNYLPNSQHQLSRNEFYNIGFTRYFN